MDNAVAHLSSRGFEIIHRYPAEGDLLSISDETVSPTIVLGGSQNVTDIKRHPYLEDELRWIQACLESDIPILGICLGGQLLAHTLGAQISAREPAECEFGFYEVTPTTAGLDWLQSPHHVVQAHFQEFSLPDGAELLATGEQFKQQAFRYGDSAYGVQFHPEVNIDILENWLHDDWAEEMLDTHGAQSVDEQLRLAKKYLTPQRDWFTQALDTLFLPTAR